MFIPHNNKIYSCPELITHYIDAHSYLPPGEFVEAVYLCPPIQWNISKKYWKMVEENWLD